MNPSLSDALHSKPKSESDALHCYKNKFTLNSDETIDLAIPSGFRYFHSLNKTLRQEM